MVGPSRFVRVGRLGHVGRFTSADATVLPRGQRVVCRTERGLELGEVLGVASPGAAADGVVLRAATIEDELLAARLERHRDEAFQACSERLRRRDIPAVLMDVEHLLDGQAVYFYFWGDFPPEAADVTAELAELYASRIHFARFHDALLHGCGPDCGTERASGCAPSGCAACAVAQACRRP